MLASLTMATMELPRAGAPDLGPQAAWAGAPQPALERSPLRERLLILALLAVVLYAALAGGATTDPAEARVQVAIALIAALTGAERLLRGGSRRPGNRLALGGVAVLGAFALWSAVTLLWSVAPDATWIEANRAIAYAVAAGLALAIGAGGADSLRRLADGLLLLVVLVGAYALGQKLVPGFHIGSLFDLNQTAVTPRLRSPLQYWNALSLFLTFGVPLAGARALDRSRRPGVRLAALSAVSLLLVTVVMTLSRGGFLALGLAIIVTLGCGGARLRGGLSFGLAALAALPAAWFALSDHRLTASAVPLDQREQAGLVLGGLLLVSLAVLVVVGRRLSQREATLAGEPVMAPRTARRIRRAILGVVLVALLALIVSPRGIGGSVSDAWHGFTQAGNTSPDHPNRLLSSESGNRWTWWKESAAAFSDRPLGGWGAGSFSVLDLLYRHKGGQSVRQPHEVPLQFLAETGVVGAGLGVGGFVLLLTAAVLAVRRRPPGSERRVAAALLAGGAAYAAHSLYDWDWDIPGVTLPALIALGAVAASSPSRPAGHSDVTLSPSGRRVLAAGALAATMALWAVSSVLPSLSAGRTQSALLTAAAAGPGSDTLRSALATALLASRLDPLSDAGLRAAATISLHGANLSAARNYLVRAVGREPDDVGAWQDLATVAAETGDLATLTSASKRVLELDPNGSTSQRLVQNARQALTPANGSATAVGTPLPSGAPNRLGVG